MDEQNESSQFTESLSPVMEQNLAAISKWTKLLSILGFSFGALVVVSMMFNGAEIINSVAAVMPIQMQGMYGILIFVFFVFFFIAAAFLYFLYKASTLLFRGVQRKDSIQIAEGFSNLKLVFFMAAIYGALQLIGNLTNLIKLF
jgi:hypothetical protein